jgi:uncharacterized protein YhaN
MKYSISGYNVEAKKGRAAVTQYCQAWKNELTAMSAALSKMFAAKEITLAMHNKKREAINKSVRELNECIKTINRQFAEPKQVKQAEPDKIEQEQTEDLS